MLGRQWPNGSRARGLAGCCTRRVPDRGNRGGGSHWTTPAGGCSCWQRNPPRIDRAASELRTRLFSLTRGRKLSASMSLTQFDHGYWYATELKRFAAELGIPSVARLRKDELERAIRQFLRSGKTEAPTAKAGAFRCPIAPTRCGPRPATRSPDHSLHQRSGDQVVPGAGSQKARSHIPSTFGCNVQIESMEREATLRRSRADVSGPGCGVSSPDAVHGPFCSGSAWPLHQLPQRFHEATPWSRQGRSHRGVARAEGHVLPEDLSRLGQSANA